MNKGIATYGFAIIYARKLAYTIERERYDIQKPLEELFISTN